MGESHYIHKSKQANFNKHLTAGQTCKFLSMPPQTLTYLDPCTRQVPIFVKSFGFFPDIFEFFSFYLLSEVIFQTRLISGSNFQGETLINSCCYSLSILSKISILFLQLVSLHPRYPQNLALLQKRLLK